MYRWMARWLKVEGDGTPIPEPKHEVETPEDLRCFPDNVRPKGFLFPPTFAAREARALVTKVTKRVPDHAEEWESAAALMRAQLRKQLFGDPPKLPKPAAKLGDTEVANGIATNTVLLFPEPKLPLPAIMKSKRQIETPQPACVLLHLDGKSEALKHPLAAALVNKGWLVLAADLRATGETRPASDAIAGAPDHNSAEHGLWIGRPLLGQWLFDVAYLLAWLGMQPSLDRRRLAVAGIGDAGVVAICAAATLEGQASALAAGSMSSYITETAYPSGTHMGLLAPGILRVGDIPQLAAMIAPRRLILADGVAPQGYKHTENQLREAYAFTQHVYKLFRAEDKLTATVGSRTEDLVSRW